MVVGTAIMTTKVGSWVRFSQTSCVCYFRACVRPQGSTNGYDRSAPRQIVRGEGEDPGVHCCEGSDNPSQLENISFVGWVWFPIFWIVPQFRNLISHKTFGPKRTPTPLSPSEKKPHQLHHRPDRNKRHTSYRSPGFLDHSDSERYPLRQEAEQAKPQYS